MDRMIWIHADDDMKELRAIDLVESADMQIKTAQGSDLIDNTWSMTIPEKEWQKNPVYKDHYIYSPGTEWGGPVKAVEHNTESRLITLQGPTWRGLLYQKRIYPPEGYGYLVFTNIDANELIRQVVGNVFGNLVRVVSTSAGVNVSASFRYETIANGLQDVFREYNLRLDVSFDNANGQIVLEAKQTTDLTDDIEISQDYGVHFTSKIGNIEFANHCLALGQGELENRLVINVYVTEDGYYTSRPAELPEADVRTVLLDYPNAEDAQDLLKSAIARLKDVADENAIEVNELRAVNAEMGDVVSIRDRVTGLSGQAEISNKILKITEGMTRITMDIEKVKQTGGE